VFALMPHPERVFYRNTHPDWYRRKPGAVEGDGQDIFRSIIDHISRSF